MHQTMLAQNGRDMPLSAFLSCDFSGLKDVDGFGRLGGSAWAAAELAQDAPGLELGVGAFARAAEAGMSAVDVLLGARLCSAPARGCGCGVRMPSSPR